MARRRSPGAAFLPPAPAQPTTTSLICITGAMSV